MSNLERDPQETPCGGSTAVAEPVRELLVPREVPLGGPRSMLVQRTLPHRDRRMVGAWCFVDHYGPDDVSGRAGMQVPPHPHSGLQTVSWLLAGDVLHRDSLGNMQMVRPGELNLMTSGHAISHSEESPADHEPTLHGVQLWIALPDGSRHIDPAFAHHGQLPVLADSGVRATVLVGSLGGATSPATVYSPLVGADIALEAGADIRLPIEPDFEHAALAMSGAVEVDGVPLAVGSMVYLGSGRRDLAIRSVSGARVLLLGGEPFEEQIVMWWNFIGRSHDEIVADREDWETGRRFGTVHGFDGHRLAAPPMPMITLKPRGRQR